MNRPANINAPENWPARKPSANISVCPTPPRRAPGASFKRGNDSFAAQRPRKPRFRLLPVLVCILTLIGCGNDDTPAPSPVPPAETTPTAAVSPEASQVTMKGADFYLYDKRTAVGDAQKPMVSIKAEEFSLGTGEVASYAFKNVKATLHLPDGKDIIFEAAEGSFVEDVKAYLKGGVRAQVNEMKIELEDIELSAPRVDAPGIAFSDHPVLLAGPGIEIRAAGLRLYPDEKKLELNTGSGYFEFGRFQQ